MIPKYLRGASDATRTLVKRLKPYKGGTDAFWRLHKLDILDKHTILVPVGATNAKVLWRPNIGEMFKQMGVDESIPIPNMGNLVLTPEKRTFPLKDGDVVFGDGASGQSGLGRILAEDSNLSTMPPLSPAVVPKPIYGTFPPRVIVENGPGEDMEKQSRPWMRWLVLCLVLAFGTLLLATSERIWLGEFGEQFGAALIIASVLGLTMHYMLMLILHIENQRLKPSYQIRFV